jgi:hypothetical protein
MVPLLIVKMLWRNEKVTKSIYLPYTQKAVDAVVHKVKNILSKEWYTLCQA